MVCDWLQNTGQPSLNQPSERKLHGLRLTTKYRTTVFESAIRVEITWSATDYKIQDNRLWISHPSGNYMVCDWLQNTGQPSLNQPSERKLHGLRLTTKYRTTVFESAIRAEITWSATDYKIQDNRLWISHPSGNYMVCDWLQNTGQPSLNQPSERKLHGLRLTTKYRTTVFESAIRAEITWSATDYKIQDNRLWISHPSGNYMVCDWLQNTGQPSLNQPSERKLHGLRLTTKYRTTVFESAIRVEITWSATDYKIQDNRLWISHPSGNYMVCDWLQNTGQPSLNQPSERKLHGLRLTTKYRTTVFESAIRAEITWSATDYKIQDNRLWISHPSGNYMVCDWLQNTGQPSLNQPSERKLHGLRLTTKYRTTVFELAIRAEITWFAINRTSSDIALTRATAHALSVQSKLQSTQSHTEQSRYRSLQLSQHHRTGRMMNREDRLKVNPGSRSRMPGYILTYSRTFYNPAGFSAARTATTIPNFCVRCILPPRDQVIIIMYIYHALTNALSAQLIHINLNIIFYTHVVM